MFGEKQEFPNLTLHVLYEVFKIHKKYSLFQGYTTGQSQITFMDIAYVQADGAKCH